jgi:hypothetical protein
MFRNSNYYKEIGKATISGINQSGYAVSIFHASIDLLRNYFRSEIMIFRAKTMKREEVNTTYSLTSGELFAAEKS